mgnify:CR=1 FL=1
MEEHIQVHLLQIEEAQLKAVAVAMTTLIDQVLEQPTEATLLTAVLQEHTLLAHRVLQTAVEQA